MIIHATKQQRFSNANLSFFCRCFFTRNERYLKKIKMLINWDYVDVEYYHIMHVKWNRF